MFFLKDRLEKWRQQGGRFEADKHNLQEEIARCESRAAKLDLQRVALEGDIQRLQMILQEKDNLLRNIQERLDGQSRSSMQLEDRYNFIKDRTRIQTYTLKNLKTVRPNEIVNVKLFSKSVFRLQNV